MKTATKRRAKKWSKGSDCAHSMVSPMLPGVRAKIYAHQNGGGSPKPGQRRRFRHKANAELGRIEAKGLRGAVKQAALKRVAKAIREFLT